MLCHTYLVQLSRLKPGEVSPLSSSISEVVWALLPTPPNNITPCGEAQALWARLPWAKLFDCSQEPMLVRVWHVVLAVDDPEPPHAVSPVWEWELLL